MQVINYHKQVITRKKFKKSVKNLPKIRSKILKNPPTKKYARRVLFLEPIIR